MLKKNSEEIKSFYEQAASQVQVTNQVYSLEKELLVKNREDKLGGFTRLNIDACGPLPITSKGNRYLITAICMSSKFPEAIPVSDISSVSVTNALLNIFSRMGFPREIQCDQGTSFTSALTTEFFERFGILVRHSSVYHPQSNPVERFHRTLKRLLRVLCLDAGSEWDKHLPSILLALRTVSHESTGYTPSELVYGKNLRTPETLVIEHWMETEEGDLITEYMFKLINRLKRCQEVAINKMEEMQVKRKTWYDKNAVKREFKDGDLVLVLATSRANKLAVQWIGPGTILNKISETNYLVEIPGRRESSQIYHINMLKPYYKRPEHVNVSELNKHLHDKQMDRLRELLNKYSKCFSNNPGLTNLVEHEIQLVSDQPVRTKPYRMSHLKHMETVLQRIKRAKLTIKPSKCCSRVPYPSHENPNTCFLRSSGLLPKYINLFSVIAAPLTDALKGRAKKGEITWTTECENAFRELKGKLIDKPVLYAPNFEREFIVQMDASNAGMGAVLTQLNEQGEEHPILYLGKKFSEVEKRYCTTEKECASIVFAIKRLHYYLDGNSFLVMTDHNPLVWLNRNVSSNPRLMRWALALQPYKFRIVHRSGKSHKNADSLSRSVIDN
ncbi:retrovirus-related Pol polyprotein from transposon 297 [Trichonephila clavipes]|nr:retrovirus-related Pol polyprotein from transposon 297 [Trichonephila clavipes]